MPSIRKEGKHNYLCSCGNGNKEVMFNGCCINFPGVVCLKQRCNNIKNNYNVSFELSCFSMYFMCGNEYCFIGSTEELLEYIQSIGLCRMKE
jgi:hypothetical protein